MEMHMRRRLPKKHPWIVWVLLAVYAIFTVLCWMRYEPNYF